MPSFPLESLTTSLLIAAEDVLSGPAPQDFSREQALCDGLASALDALADMLTTANQAAPLAGAIMQRRDRMRILAVRLSQHVSEEV